MFVITKKFTCNFESVCFQAVEFNYFCQVVSFNFSLRSQCNTYVQGKGS